MSEERERLVADAASLGEQLGDEMTESLAQSLGIAAPIDLERPVTVLEQMDAWRRFAEHRLPKLEPDEDLIATTEIATEKALVPIVHPMFGDDARAAAIQGFLPSLMSTLDARSYVFLDMMWGLPPGAAVPGEDGYVPPSEHPGRLELVVLTGSDGVEFHSSSRAVRRSEGAPEWAESAWRTTRLPIAQAGGPSVAPLVNALWRMRIARASRVVMYSRPAEWWTEERLDAARSVFALIAESGDTRKGQRQMVELDAERLIAAHGVLGLIDTDARRPTAEVVELAARADLWEIQMANDDVLRGYGVEFF